jgi:hypothetical protein
VVVVVVLLLLLVVLAAAVVLVAVVVVGMVTTLLPVRRLRDQVLVAVPATLLLPPTKAEVQPSSMPQMVQGQVQA